MVCDTHQPGKYRTTPQSTSVPDFDPYRHHLTTAALTVLQRLRGYFMEASIRTEIDATVLRKNQSAVGVGLNDLERNEGKEKLQRFSYNKYSG